MKSSQTSDTHILMPRKPSQAMIKAWMTSLGGNDDKRLNVGCAVLYYQDAIKAVEEDLQNVE